MTSNSRPLFSVCIPAYNRARHLAPLLDSIFAQEEADFEVVICEDMSRERKAISAIANEYSVKYPGKIHYIENSDNLGYDANVRNLISNAHGTYCFFMGNDDLMSPDALAVAKDIIERHPDVGFILRSYAWFDEEPGCLAGTVRYFNEERIYPPGKTAIALCVRRSGVISGYIIHRDSADEAATEKFDGTLYYQMHLTASVLTKHSAVATPNILVLCRNSEAPDFGNSVKEKGKFVPGHYTPEARLKMIGGVIAIVKDLKRRQEVDVVGPVMRDYANYFYPYVRDQLNLPLHSYFALYLGFAKLGFWRYPMFHLYTWLCYALKQKRFDSLVQVIRTRLGRSPQFGIAK